MVAYLALGALLGIAGYVRIAPSDPARWHVSPHATGAWGEVTATSGSASARLPLSQGDPFALLGRLDAIAVATPRTQRLAGRVDEGRVTWITRSALWGFPDYTTAEAREDGLYIYARLRFGGGDMGVNAARLRDWLSRL
jgi:hypothetical protein